MFEFEANEAVIMESKKVLETALSTNPKTQAVLRKMIRAYVLKAREQVVNSIHFKNGDPRGAREAVRTTVYKKVLGANINIFSRRKASGKGNAYEPPRKLRPKQRGGNRVVRSDRTYDFLHKYGPLDRGMILRWVNSGTDGRYAGYGRNGRNEAERNKFILNSEGRGWRGKIAARNFFKPLGDRAMGQMRDNLEIAIEEELTKLFNE
jgi:hypothetical protein